MRGRRGDPYKASTYYNELHRDRRSEVRLVLRDVDEEMFQTLFEGCGDSDPLALCLDGEPIGLVLVRYSDEHLAKLEALGIGWEQR